MCSSDLEFLVNAWPRFRLFWEHYLCYVVRGKVMEFEFEVLKDGRDGEAGSVVT